MQVERTDKGTGEAEGLMRFLTFAKRLKKHRIRKPGDEVARNVSSWVLRKGPVLDRPRMGCGSTGGRGVLRPPSQTLLAHSRGCR